MNLPLISICIPTYNGEKYLQEALDSVKTQTYKNIEVIISDDNSKDNTLQICERFKAEVDFPVFVLNHIPKGIGVNWNNCIKNANGEYIKFLFQDDLLYPNCIEKMLQIVVEYNVSFVASNRDFIYNEKYMDDNLNNWINRFSHLYLTINLNFDENNVALIDNKLFSMDCFHLSPNNKIGEPTTVFFSKELYREIGEFNVDLKQMLDYEYWYRVLKKYPIVIINENLVSFRLHSMQATAINNNNKLSESDYFIKFIENDLFKFLSTKKKISIIWKKIKSFKLI